ncbi:hypothetical protein [Bacillus infantis]|uniref:hypothetical protein n=1 Tax=Bacillus infantis TaxID=324767 RepID=UPI003CF6622D
MFYRVCLLKGILYPKYASYQLEQAEKINGVWIKSILIILISAFALFFSSFSGIGTESLSKEAAILKPSDYEMHKLYFAAGKAVWGVFYPLLMILLPAVIFWTLTDIAFKKIVTIQLFAVFLLVVSKVLALSSASILEISTVSSPFSLAVIAQYVTSNEFIIYLLENLSIFHLWAIYIQYIYLKKLSEKKPRTTLIIVVSVNIFFWLMSALFSYIKFEMIL